VRLKMIVDLKVFVHTPQASEQGQPSAVQGVPKPNSETATLCQLSASTRRVWCVCTKSRVAEINTRMNANRQSTNHHHYEPQRSCHERSVSFTKRRGKGGTFKPPRSVPPFDLPKNVRCSSKIRSKELSAWAVEREGRITL
jgi:hypothetical protein